MLYELSPVTIMTFNKYIWIVGTPRRADTSAPTEGRISLFICMMVNNNQEHGICLF